MFRVAIVLAILVLPIGCSLVPTGPEEQDEFEFKVSPSGIDDSVVDQESVLLVHLDPGTEDSIGSSKKVTISATADNSTITVINDEIGPGDVAEVRVKPSTMPNDDGTSNDDSPFPDSGTVEVTIRAERGTVVREQTVGVTVVSDEEIIIDPEAAAVRELFIPFLAQEHPELGIDTDTEWENEIVTPHVLIVTHYLFFSEEWEMHVCWHVMIPPHDWARIELRRRFSETEPSLAFEVTSRSADEPDFKEIEPSELWR